MPVLHPDRLFPPDPRTRDVARRLYEAVRGLPIISPHGHTEARWFARDEPFANPAALLIQPDHYVYRMLYSQGVRLEELGIGAEADPRAVWRVFAQKYRLFRGTPTKLWLDWVFAELFGLREELNETTAGHFYNVIAEHLEQPAFRPRALYRRFGIEVLATTDGALDGLEHHRALRDEGWEGRVIPTFRPDAVVDPDWEGFGANLDRLGEQTGQDTGSWAGYLQALRTARARFKALGATATDHGHPSALTANLQPGECERLFARVRGGGASAEEVELFRAQMLTEMAAMSLEDGLVMQLHAGSVRNHNAEVFRQYGRDRGADIPQAMHYVEALRPLLERFGNRADLTLIVFTLDEASYSRELAPLAGHYPCLRLGPPWWFHDSPEGMLRFREAVTGTAGFGNTVGFNDDTRAFLSIPARHDVARRMDCSFLARLVAEHRLGEVEALEVAEELTVKLPRQAYRLEGNARMGLG